VIIIGLSRASDLLNETWQILIYGDNRSGKSYLLGSVKDCEELQPALIINGDFSSTTFARHFPELDVFTFTGEKSLPRQIKDVIKIIKEGKYKFVGFDNASVFMDRLVREFADGKKASWDDWSNTFMTTQNFLEDIKNNIPYFACTAMPMNVDDGQGNVLRIVPFVYGSKYPMTFNSLFDIITFLEFDESKQKGKYMETRILTGKRKGLEIVGDRNNLIDQIQDPTFRKILDILKEGNK
jgi:hypothetical protein